MRKRNDPPEFIKAAIAAGRLEEFAPGTYRNLWGGWAADPKSPREYEDPLCDCYARGCGRQTCKGECGCEACRLSWMDYQSNEWD